jgi:hypothetical protein
LSLPPCAWLPLYYELSSANAQTQPAHLRILTVMEQNLAARRLYEKLGFQTAYTYWYRVKRG